MTHTRIRAAGAGLALGAVAMALAAGTAAAGPKHANHVSGTWGVAGEGTTTCDPEPKHPERLRCETTGFQSSYDGDLQGLSAIDFGWKIDCAKGRAEGGGDETLTGSLDGSPAGTLTWRIHFRADFDCTTFLLSNFDAHAEIRDGTGGFDRVHGNLRFDDTTYEGNLH
jgi:hypothetical protein